MTTGSNANNRTWLPRSLMLASTHIGQEPAKTSQFMAFPSYSKSSVPPRKTYLQASMSFHLSSIVSNQRTSTKNLKTTKLTLKAPPSRASLPRTPMMRFRSSTMSLPRRAQTLYSWRIRKKLKLTLRISKSSVLLEKVASAKYSWSKRSKIKWYMQWNLWERT